MKKRKYAFTAKMGVFYSSFSFISGTILLVLSISITFYFQTTITNRIALFFSESYTTGEIVEKGKTKEEVLNRGVKGVFGQRKEETNAKVQKKYLYLVNYQIDSSKYQNLITSHNVFYEQKIKLKYVLSDPNIVNFADDILFDAIVVGLLAFFPFLGIILFAYGFKIGLKNVFLIENGELALGKFTHSEATNLTANGAKIMKLYFSFTDKYGKTQTVFTKTHLVDRLTDEPFEMLLYVPKKPNYSVFVDLLPKIVRKTLQKEIEKLKMKK